MREWVDEWLCGVWAVMREWAAYMSASLCGWLWQLPWYSSMLTPLFDLLFLDNDLQEQWSDEVSVDTNLTSYDVQSHHEHQEQLMMLQ